MALINEVKKHPELWKEKLHHNASYNYEVYTANKKVVAHLNASIPDFKKNPITIRGELWLPNSALFSSSICSQLSVIVVLLCLHVKQKKKTQFIAGSLPNFHWGWGRFCCIYWMDLQILTIEKYFQTSMGWSNSDVLTFSDLKGVVTTTATVPLLISNKTCLLWFPIA